MRTLWYTMFMTSSMWIFRVYSINLPFIKPLHFARSVASSYNSENYSSDSGICWGSGKRERRRARRVERREECYGSHSRGSLDVDDERLTGMWTCWFVSCCYATVTNMQLKSDLLQFRASLCLVSTWSPNRLIISSKFLIKVFLKVFSTPPSWILISFFTLNDLEPSQSFKVILDGQSYSKEFS